MSELSLSGKKIEFVSQEVDVTFTVAAGISSGTMFHDLLSNRDEEDQHSIEAITGLVSGLGGKSQIGHTHSEYALVVHEHTKDQVGLEKVDNTEDILKPISIDAQAALDLKMDSATLAEVNNTSDANKPVSTAQQAALDLKVDTASWVNFFQRVAYTTATITADEPTYEEVGRLTMSALVSGAYQVTIAGRVQCDTLGRMAFLRWSLDGGATWEEPAVYDVLGVTDKTPFTHVEFQTFASGDRVVIVQAAKDSGAGSMIINKLDIACERKS